MRAFLVAATSLAVFACADEPGSWVCGNGVCESAESSVSCAADCSSSGPTCGDGHCASTESVTTCFFDCGCLSDDECAFDEFCYDSCQGVLGRSYDVVIVSAATGTTKPDGSAWDFGGGAPDLSVVFGVEGGQMCETTVVQDAFSATWNVACDFILNSGDRFVVQLWDNDVSDHDKAAGWFWEGTDSLVALVRTGLWTVTAETQTETVTLQVIPRS